MHAVDESDKSCCSRGFSITAAVVIACLIFVGLVAKMRQYTTPPALTAARMEERAKALRELRGAELDALQNPGWVDQGKGLVRLPIKDAQDLTVRAWQNPAKARADLLAREAKATFVAPPPPSPLE